MIHFSDFSGEALMSEPIATTLLPSAQMMFRVGGDDRPDVYLQVGTRCFADIQAIAADAGRPLDSFASVLDYGCGCGRVLRFWPTIEGQSIHGTDIDGDAIEWCRSAMPNFTFNRNGELPPTAYDAGRFDLIYSVSVFSHLRPDYAKPWVAELKRIAAPGALLIISLHGSHLLPDESGLRDGLLFQETESWSEHFPPWYGNLYVSEAGARQLFNSFDVINFIPRGLANHQDVIILTTRTPSRWAVDS
jgi:SAM-dependent methyltransferase